MNIETTLWDASEHLDSDEAIAAYLNEILRQNDSALFTAALGDIARAKGMTDIAKLTGLSRESLYRALSGEGNPSMATVMKVIEALRVRLEARPVTNMTDLDSPFVGPVAGLSALQASTVSPARLRELVGDNLPRRRLTGRAARRQKLRVRRAKRFA